MIDPAVMPWLLAAVPMIGAAASLLFWSDAERLKQSALVWSLISIAPVIGFTGHLTMPPEGFLSLYLLPLAALVSILGQPVQPEHRLSWVLTLAWLGLGLGILAGGDLAGRLFLMVLLLSIIVRLSRHHTELWPISWWGIGLFSFAILCIALSVLTGPPVSSVASLVTCAILLPLLPFHDGHLTVLTRLPGNLPTFIVVLLPVIGQHEVSGVLTAVPEVVAWAVGLFALIGALYGALKALVQTRVRLLLAYGSLSLYSLVWWFLVTTREATPRMALLVGAVGLATSGLLLGWQVIRTRYGDDVDPQAISGLAAAMPQYAVLLSLTALAAMGLPPFGVFAGFTGLLLISTHPTTIGLGLALLAWLSASWYLMQMVQQLLFGPRRPDIRYTELLPTETAALAIVVCALLILGLAPADLFTFGQPAQTTGAFTHVLTWNR